MREYFATMEIKKMMIPYAENIFVKMKEGIRLGLTVQIMSL